MQCLEMKTYIIIRKVKHKSQDPVLIFDLFLQMNGHSLYYF